MATLISGAGCGVVSGGSKSQTGLLGMKQVAGLRPGSGGLRPESGGLRPMSGDIELHPVSDGLRPELGGLRPGSGNVELLVLDEVEPQAELVGNRQELANAQDQWVVMKVRMHLRIQGMKNDESWGEFKQFEAWSYDMQLQ